MSPIDSGNDLHTNPRGKATITTIEKGKTKNKEGIVPRKQTEHKERTTWG
jgi:hypothetical protein